MQEVLAITDSFRLALSEREFYEIQVSKSSDKLNSDFIVMTSHSCWSEADQQFMWDEIEQRSCPTLELAKHVYELKRRALVERGFCHSDMEF